VIYSRQDILDVFMAMQKFTPLPIFDNVSSADLRRSSTNVVCPKCGKDDRKVLVRIGNVWACYACHKVENTRKAFFRTSLIYLVANDLLTYFGEVTTERILDPKLMEAFIEFTGAEDFPLHFLFINKFVKAVLSKDVGVLPILGFLNVSDAKLKTMQGKVKEQSGADIRKDKVNVTQPAEAPVLGVPAS